MTHVPMSRAPMPQTLQLQRLARSRPNEWLALPDAEARLLWLEGKKSEHLPAGVLICLEGEVLADLPNLQFVQLRPYHSYSAAAPMSCELLATQGTALLLWLKQA